MTKINLRAIEREDLEMLKQWRNDPKIQPFVREYRLLSSQDQIEWYENYHKSRRKADFDQELMIIEADGEPCGVGGFVKIEWKNQKAELSFYTIDDDLIEMSLFEILRKGFLEFNLNKIYWPVYSHDKRLSSYKKVLRQEAILKEEYYYGGKFQDRIYLAITKKEFDKK